MHSNLIRAPHKITDVMMTMSETIEIDASGAVKTFKTAGVNVHKATQNLIARLSLKGESFIKDRRIVPVRTGTLYRAIHAYPTVHPVGIAAGVNYAFAANVRSKRPRFIERTHAYIIRIFPHEADLVLKNALEGMQK